TGAMSFTGGEASGASDAGGGVESVLLAGNTVQNSGNITLQGGNATGATSTGGSISIDANDWSPEVESSIGLWSTEGTSTNTATTLVAKGGTGNPTPANDGTNGIIRIDGQD